MSADWPALLSLALTVFIIANLAVGYTFSTMASNQLQAMQMTQFFLLPAILLSGFAFPFDGMPRWAQWIGEALPATHVLRIVRGIMLKDNGWPEIWPDMWPLFLFTFLAGSIALFIHTNTGQLQVREGAGLLQGIQKIYLGGFVGCAHCHFNGRLSGELLGLDVQNANAFGQNLARAVQPIP